jgi:hypothetical protein
VAYDRMKRTYITTAPQVRRDKHLCKVNESGIYETSTTKFSDHDITNACLIELETLSAPFCADNVCNSIRNARNEFHARGQLFSSATQPHFKFRRTKKH